MQHRAQSQVYTARQLKEMLHRKGFKVISQCEIERLEIHRK